MINNRYSINSRFFISYEIGVMIASIDNQPANIFMVDSVERICKNVKLNNIMVAEGIYHCGKENSIEYSVDDINGLLKKLGLDMLKI